MEFRVFIHLSSFNLNTHDPDYVFKLLGKIYDGIQKFCDQRDSYKRFNLIEKISLYVDVDLRSLVCRGQSLFGFLFAKYKHFQLFQHIFKFQDITQLPLTVLGHTYNNQSLGNSDITNTVGSELYEFQDGATNFGIILCRSNCSSFINGINSIIKSSSQSKDLLHYNLFSLNLNGDLVNHLARFIYEHGTGSFPAITQTFLRNHRVYVSSPQHPGQPVYTDGQFYYKVDRTHTDDGAHVERSLNGSFNDRIRRDIYENKPK